MDPRAGNIPLGARVSRFDHMKPEKYFRTKFQNFTKLKFQIDVLRKFYPMRVRAALASSRLINRISTWTKIQQRQLANFLVSRHLLF